MPTTRILCSQELSRTVSVPVNNTTWRFADHSAVWNLSTANGGLFNPLLADYNNGRIRITKLYWTFQHTTASKTYATWRQNSSLGYEQHSASDSVDHIYDVSSFYPRTDGSNIGGYALPTEVSMRFGVRTSQSNTGTAPKTVWMWFTNVRFNIDWEYTYSQCTAPTTVQLSAATCAPNGTRTLSWSGATAGHSMTIAGYYIFRVGTAAPIAEVGASVNSFTVTGPSTQGAQYSFCVATKSSVSAEYDSPVSSQVTLTCDYSSPSQVSSYLNTTANSALAVDINIGNSAATQYTIKLQWSAPAAGTNNSITEYRVYQKAVDGTKDILLASFPPNTYSYNIATIEPAGYGQQIWTMRTYGTGGSQFNIVGSYYVQACGAIAGTISPVPTTCNRVIKKDALPALVGFSSTYGTMSATDLRHGANQTTTLSWNAISPLDAGGALLYQTYIRKTNVAEATLVSSANSSCTIQLSNYGATTAGEELATQTFGYQEFPYGGYSASASATEIVIVKTSDIYLDDSFIFSYADSMGGYEAYAPAQLAQTSAKNSTMGLSMSFIFNNTTNSLFSSNQYKCALRTYRTSSQEPYSVMEDILSGAPQVSGKLYYQLQNPGWPTNSNYDPNFPIPCHFSFYITDKFGATKEIFITKTEFGTTSNVEFRRYVHITANPITINTLTHKQYQFFYQGIAPMAATTNDIRADYLVSFADVGGALVSAIDRRGVSVEADGTSGVNFRGYWAAANYFPESAKAQFFNTLGKNRKLQCTLTANYYYYTFPSYATTTTVNTQMICDRILRLASDEWSAYNLGFLNADGGEWIANEYINAGCTIKTSVNEKTTAEYYINDTFFAANQNCQPSITITVDATSDSLLKLRAPLVCTTQTLAHTGASASIAFGSCADSVNSGLLKLQFIPTINYTDGALQVSHDVAPRTIYFYRWSLSDLRVSIQSCEINEDEELGTVARKLNSVLALSTRACGHDTRANGYISKVEASIKMLNGSVLGTFSANYNQNGLPLTNSGSPNFPWICTIADANITSNAGALFSGVMEVYFTITYTNTQGFSFTQSLAPFTLRMNEIDFTIRRNRIGVNVAQDFEAGDTTNSLRSTMTIKQRPNGANDLSVLSLEALEDSTYGPSMIFVQGDEIVGRISYEDGLVFTINTNAGLKEFKLTPAGELIGVGQISSLSGTSLQYTNITSNLVTADKVIGAVYQ